MKDKNHMTFSINAEKIQENKCRIDIRAARDIHKF